MALHISGRNAMNYPKQSMQFNLSLALVGALLLSQPTPTKTDMKDWAVVGAITGAAVALASGIAYLFQETDEEALSNADKDFVAAYLEFRQEVDSFSAQHYVTSVNTTLSDITYTEEELHVYVKRFIECCTSARIHAEKVNKSLSTLEKNAANLYERIQYLERRPYDRESVNMARAMRAMRKQITDFSPYLRLYYTFLREHRSYFELYEYEVQLSEYYRQESMYAYQYAYDPVGFAYGVKLSVGSHTDLYGQFKMIAYKKRVDTDLKELYKKVKSLSYSYSMLYTTAIQWQDFLKRISGIVAMDSDYRYEIQEQAHQIQRSKELELAERATHLKECEVRARNEANRIEREKLRLERERRTDEADQGDGAEFSFHVEINLP
jgi:hypothetical protein